jgi:hypothetical protein
MSDVLCSEGNQPATENSVPIEKQLYRESGTPRCLRWENRVGSTERASILSLIITWQAGGPPSREAEHFWKYDRFSSCE